MQGGDDHEPNEPMRILVHDYGGYPFIVQLSRELARRGHQVLHIYADGFRKPKGPMDRLRDDPEALSLAPVTLNEPLRGGGWRRVTQERRYGSLLQDRIYAFRPQVVLSANAPLEIQAATAGAAHAIGAASIMWLQDLHSVAIARITGRRVRMLGLLIGAWYGRIERRLLRTSDAVVAVSSSYLPMMAGFRMPMDRVFVIENWAPLQDTPLPPKVNAWSQAQGLDDRAVLLYAGTLALKHNPKLLLELALNVPDASVVVVSEGAGADWLRAHASALDNLRVLPFEPYDRLPEMLASADLLLAVLEHDASGFSVPSKVLTYLAAGRAILAAIPIENPAARLIEGAGAGTVVDPGDVQGLVAAALALLADPSRLASAGAAAHTYAQGNFSIGPIADQFEAVIASAVRRHSHSPIAAQA
jgi:colanic acid biosynthesis glycosyl transferase WcaI